MPNYRVGTRYDRFLYFHKKGSSSDVEIYVRLDFNVEQMVKDLVANLHASKAVRDFKIKNDIDYLHSYNLHEQTKKEKTEQIKNKTRQPVHARDGRRRGVHGRPVGRFFCCLFFVYNEKTHRF